MKVLFLSFILLIGMNVGYSQKILNRSYLEALNDKNGIHHQSQNFRILISDLNSFQNWFQDSGSTLIYSENLNNGLYLFELKCDYQQIKELAKFWWIKSIDRGRTLTQEESSLSNFNLKYNRIDLMKSQWPEYSGRGTVASIKEDPYDTEDIDLIGRNLAPVQDLPNSRHATEMATIVVGAGNTSPKFQGVAHSAQINTSNLGDLFPDSIDSLISQKINTQNHSYGVGLENYYGIESYLYDLRVQEKEDVLHVFSSGNRGLDSSSDGKYAGINQYATLTGQFKTSKNTLCVGASDRFGQVLNIKWAYRGRSVKA